MDKLIKREKENIILNEIYKRKKLFVKDLYIIPEIAKNSIYRHIKDLIKQKLIEKISVNPIVVTFPLIIRIFLMKIQEEELMKLNDLEVFIKKSDLKNTEILERFVEANILEITPNEKFIYVSLVETNPG